MSLKQAIEDAVGDQYTVFIEENFMMQFDECTRITVTQIDSGYETMVILNNAVEQSEEEMAQIVLDRVITSGVVDETFEE